jgi:hypothetical protein
VLIFFARFVVIILSEKSIFLKNNDNLLRKIAFCYQKFVFDRLKLEIYLILKVGFRKIKVLSQKIVNFEILIFLQKLC